MIYLVKASEMLENRLHLYFKIQDRSFFTVNSSSEVAFGLENFGLSHDEIVDRVNTGFSKFGLEYLKDRAVFELSSGERQLVAILSAWAL